MALCNRELCGKETVFLLSSKELVHISSSRIRELAMFNRRLEGFIPTEIEEVVYLRLFESYKDKPLFNTGVQTTGSKLMPAKSNE